MQNKLQELTDKLYAEGLSKGKQEGEEILAKAKVQAEEIVAKAHAEAAAIVAAAKKDAEDLRTKVQSDVKMAAAQSVAATKKDIETLVVAKMTEAEVKNALTSADFVKEVILAVAKGFNTEEPVDLEVVLPETLKKDLEGFEVAGEDKVFYPAVARVSTKDYKVIEVSCPEVPNPVAVRYGMRNWSKASVFSHYGIPASPFRSDDWEK